MPERTEMHKTVRLVIAVVAAAVLVPTGVNAAVDAFRLQDGDGTSKAQVDKGAVRVGDGDGDLSVDGAVGIQGRTNSTDARLLANGDCNTQEHTSTHSHTDVIPAGTTVTEIVMTTEWDGGARSTMIIKSPSVPGFNPANGNHTEQIAGRLMALQVGWTQGYADFNETVNFGDGVKLEDAWHIFCGGVIGSSQGGALWNVYGYDA